MKQILSWLRQRDQKRSKSTPDVVEDVKEACLSYGAQMSGIDFVLRRHYGDYNH